jgi:hypothetical protein
MRAKKAAELESASNTFEKLAREWYASKRKGWTNATAVRTIGALELYVFPVFGTPLPRPFYLSISIIYAISKQPLSAIFKKAFNRPQKVRKPSIKHPPKMSNP